MYYMYGINVASCDVTIAMSYFWRPTASSPISTLKYAIPH